MKNILNLIKNEYIKLFSQKKIYAILAYIILISIFTIKAYNGNDYKIEYSNSLTPNLNFLLSNLNAVNYLKIFSTDSIFGGTTQFSLMLISILAIDTFSSDYTSGNAKYVLSLGISKLQLTLSKYIYMIINIVVLICLFFIFGFILGGFFLGVHGVTLKSIFETFVLYLFGALPMIAFTSIIALISITNINKSTLTLISIISIFILGLSDTFTKTKFFSPTGMLALFNSDVPLKITNNMILCGFISLLYFTFTLYMYIMFLRKKDIFN